MGFLDRLAPTLIIRSKKWGRQYYYQTMENMLIKLYMKEKPNWRTSSDWWYVVGAGSYVPSDENNNDGDGTYRIFAGNKVNSFRGYRNTLKMREILKKLNSIIQK